MPRPLLILDRDGVINNAPTNGNRYILKASDLIIRQGVIREIARIQKFGDVAVATNQQCVGKNLISESELNSLHCIIDDAVVKEGGRPLQYFICPHLESEGCSCRKPNPGLLKEAMDHFHCDDPSRALFIGDKESDRLAALGAGTTFVLASTEIEIVTTLEKFEAH